MSVSETKIIANQQNAAKSTGPNTIHGKQQSSQNAVKFGLYSKNVIVKSQYYQESIDEYNELVESLYEELKPTSPLQEHLVRKIANNLWRSRRVVMAETARINYQLKFVDGTKQDRFTEIGDRILPYKESNDNILMYEMRLDKQLARTYQLLKELQKVSEKAEGHSSLNETQDPPQQTEQADGDVCRESDIANGSHIGCETQDSLQQTVRADGDVCRAQKVT
jgi:hypothetical protein